MDFNPKFNALRDTNDIRTFDNNQNVTRFDPQYQQTVPPANQMMYGVGQFAPLPTADMQPVLPTESVDMNGLITESIKPKTISGLSMSNLIVKEEPQPQPEETPAANVSFNDLVYQDTRNIGREFTVAPMPEGQERSMLPKPELHLNKNVNNSNNNQNNSGGKKVNNWISRLIDQRGADYITGGKLTTDEVGRNAERIIDDMINGRIDYNVYGQYIITPVIIETLINYCYNKIAINNAIQFSLGYTYNDYASRQNIQDPQRLYTLNEITDSMYRNMTQAISIVNQDLNIYNIIYSKLTTLNTTKNASVLFSIANELKNYQKQIKKRY